MTVTVCVWSKASGRNVRLGRFTVAAPVSRLDNATVTFAVGFAVSFTVKVSDSPSLTGRFVGTTTKSGLTGLPLSVTATFTVADSPL